MILVCNTGPLIALAKIDRLSLLQNIGLERILIPPMVQRELWGKIIERRHERTAYANGVHQGCHA